MKWLGKSEKSLQTLRLKLEEKINIYERKLILLREKVEADKAEKRVINDRKEVFLEQIKLKEVEKNNFKKTIESIGIEIEELNNRLNELQLNLLDNNKALSESERERENIDQSILIEENLIDEMNIQINSSKNDFFNIKEELSGAERELIEISQKHRTVRKGGPLAIKFPKIENGSSRIESICLLGDIHGWAPGLFNWWMKENIHSVSISGVKLDDNKKKLDEIFPNPINRVLSGLGMPRIGIDGNPIRCKDIITPYYDLEVINGDSNKTCIILGDLIDRGDHNELVLEAIRQSILIAPGRSFFIIGNHEQMVIENDFDRWASNEKNYLYEKGKKHTGTFLHEPKLMGVETQEESMRLNFSILRGALGALLLCQHAVILSILEDEGLERYSENNNFLDSIGLGKKNIIKAIEKGGWELHQIGRQFLNQITSKEISNERIIPGALISTLCKKTLCIHAEPDSIVNMRELILDDLESTKNISEVSFGFARIKSGKISDESLLWNRGWWTEQNTSVKPVLKHKICNEIERIVHGHTASEKVRSAMSPDGVEIVAADESINPWQRYNLHPEDAMSPSRCPEGYRVIL